jgi:hypothetical protein
MANGLVFQVYAQDLQADEKLPLIAGKRRVSKKLKGSW